MYEIALETIPSAVGMLVLLAFSAFFSASEVAYFSLRPPDRKALRERGALGRRADTLLDDPDGMLSAILFWNLFVNIGYLALSGIISLKLEQAEETLPGANAWAFGFGALSLTLIIFFGELAPKSLGSLRPQTLAALSSIPLTIAIKALIPIMPLVRAIRIGTQRLFWPSFEPEPYLEIGDLERLMEKSTTDERFRDVHQSLLRNVVMLSDIQVEEWMRPRSQFPTLQPPVSRKDIQALETPYNYVFIAEPGSDVVARSLYLPELIDVPEENLERVAQPVVYVPWCATVADALEKMRVREREAAIVNEFGETIGILTFEDLLDTILNLAPSRSKIMLDAKPIHVLSENEWLVSSVTSLRRLHKFLDIELPESRSVTIAGVVQEKLHRLLQAGDVVGWGPFEIAVIEAPQRGHALLKLTLTEREDEA